MLAPGRARSSTAASWPPSTRLQGCSPRLRCGYPPWTLMAAWELLQQRCLLLQRCLILQRCLLLQLGRLLQLGLLLLKE